MSGGKGYHACTVCMYVYMHMIIQVDLKAVKSYLQATTAAVQLLAGMPRDRLQIHPSSPLRQHLIAAAALMHLT